MLFIYDTRENIPIKPYIDASSFYYDTDINIFRTTKFVIYSCGPVLDLDNISITKHMLGLVPGVEWITRETHYAINNDDVYLDTHGVGLRFIKFGPWFADVNEYTIWMSIFMP